MVSRADHRRSTLIRLGDAAIELFEARGPGVTIDEIADHAGLSRRTIFRYVEAKEQLAFVHPMLWFDVFDEALNALNKRALDESSLALGEKLRVASRAIATHIDADPEPPRHAFMVAAAHPTLVRGFNVVFQQWVDRIAAEVIADTHEPTASTIFHSRVIGSSVMGMVDAVSREWLLSPPTVSFTSIYDRGFAFIAPLFDQLEAQ